MIYDADNNFVGSLALGELISPKRYLNGWQSDSLSNGLDEHIAYSGGMKWLAYDCFYTPPFYGDTSWGWMHGSIMDLLSATKT